MEIAVLLATFNRKHKTMLCLQSLFNQLIDKDIQLNVFLTDDASTDGTANEIATKYPQIHLLRGSGSLFWAGGMRNSWGEAVKTQPDFYLLLNDDTVLKEDCIQKLLTYYTITKDQIPTITVGSTLDEAKNTISYGGHKLYNKDKIPCFNVFSKSEYLECDLANANIMMVPKAIVDQIGILSAAFTHSIADFDYTLRAKKAGFKVIVVPGVLGNCVDDNLIEIDTVKRTLRQRIAHMKSPKGLAYSEYMDFISTHFPSHKWSVFAKIWLRTFFPAIWRKLKN